MGIQSIADRQKLSRYRQSLVRLCDELSQLIQPFLSDKPVIKGSVYELKRKCGKPGCKCARGHLHESMVLSASEKGKTQLRGIPQGFLVEVQMKVRRYKRLRRARARLVEVQRSMLQLMDRMEAMRREQIPRSGKKGLLSQMDFVIFEQNKPYVLEGLGKGEFDYIEAASEVFETDFFRFIKAKRILERLAKTYPSPRKKQDVPLWLYVASNLSMRLHGVHSFNGFPLVVRCGGMLNAFGPRAGRKVIHPDTGDVTIACEGFNNKNHYDRETPCDQDFLRKMAKDTDADALTRWFCGDVAGVFRSRRAFDKEGIFIGDGSYLFVPDNPNYEGSVTLLFDEHDHPVSFKAYEKMTDEQKIGCQRRRCYKMVTLLHTNRNLDFFFFVAVKVVSGKDHECPLLYELVKQFVDTVGKGVMKRLILDRAFLDGKAISTCKQHYGIDILIPARRDMDIYEDAMALFQLPEVGWFYCEQPAVELKSPARPRPEAIVKREKKRQEKLEELKQQQPSAPPAEILVNKEAAAIGEFRSWSSCTVPLTVVANREHYADGHQHTWLLLDTKEVKDPTEAQQEYHLRTTTEERYRQLKCFCDLTNFTSRAFSMVVNQVIFIMLAYNLLQLYLLHQGRKKLNTRTPPKIRQQLLPSDNHIIVYYQNYYGLFSPLEFAEIIATLSDEPRKKVARRCRRLRRELDEVLKNPRSPP